MCRTELCVVFPATSTLPDIAGSELHIITATAGTASVRHRRGDIGAFLCRVLEVLPVPALSFPSWPLRTCAW